jgi:hypothetical protein
VDGRTLSSFGSSISFQEPNGSYSYYIGAVDDYSSAVSAGSATVAGADALVPVPFVPWNGTLSGTINVVGATLTANGNALSASGGSFNASLPPGTYTLVVTASGYNPYYDTVVVAPGRATHLSIALVGLPSTSSALTPTQVDGVIGTLLFLAVAVIVAGLLASSGRGREGARPSSPPAPWTEPPAGPKSP